MRFLAQARNPYSLSWLWIPGSFASLTPRNDSEPQHPLRHNVALDLRRAAEDGVGAAVEIFRHDRQHAFRNRGCFVEFVERSHRLDIQAVIADHVDAEP